MVYLFLALRFKLFLALELRCFGVNHAMKNFYWLQNIMLIPSILYRNQFFSLSLWWALNFVICQKFKLSLMFICYSQLDFLNTMAFHTTWCNFENDLFRYSDLENSADTSWCKCFFYIIAMYNHYYNIVW